MHRFANPARFNNLADRILPWSIAAMVALFVWGLYLALIQSPADYQQSETVRLMYIHVPAAWMSMFAYAAMATASGVSLIWRHPLADLAAKSIAPIGAMFTALALITGSLWGKPMWGTWWVWDARLTSVLVMFFMYLGYMALWRAIDDPVKAAKAAAILALVGVINLPVIKFSVDWWNTLHQPASVMKMGGPSIDPSMLWPLLVMAAAYKAYFITVMLWRMKGEMAARRLQALRYQMAGGR